jgi:hypothetical protein
MKVKEALEVGSPVVFIEAPPMLKTTDPIKIHFLVEIQEICKPG